MIVAAGTVAQPTRLTRPTPPPNAEADLNRQIVERYQHQSTPAEKAAAYEREARDARHCIPIAVVGTAVLGGAAAAYGAWWPAAGIVALGTGLTIFCHKTAQFMDQKAAEWHAAASS